MRRKSIVKNTYLDQKHINIYLQYGRNVRAILISDFNFDIQNDSAVSKLFFDVLSTKVILYALANCLFPWNSWLWSVV